MLKFSAATQDIMKRFNEYLFENLKSQTPYYEDIVCYLHENRGKQLRSVLSLLCAKLGGELNDRSYRAAMIVEMLHTASLLHDDIVDDSKERRGQPSVNEKWGKKIALFSGDLISLRALLLSLNNKDYDIFEIYGKAVDEIVQGEILQLKKAISLNSNEETYFKIIKGKTAAFFSAACKSGAVSTFTDKDRIKQLSLLGEYIGMAFQIKDDLFSYGKNNVGKPNDNDFKEKKLTLPLIYALSHTDKKNRSNIIRILKGKNFDKVRVEFIVNEVQKTGGVKYANQKMHEFGEMAGKIIRSFQQSPARDELENLIRFTTERLY